MSVEKILIKDLDIQDEPETQVCQESINEMIKETKDLLERMEKRECRLMKKKDR